MSSNFIEAVEPNTQTKLVKPVRLVHRQPYVMPEATTDLASPTVDLTTQLSPPVPSEPIQDQIDYLEHVLTSHRAAIDDLQKQVTTLSKAISRFLGHN